MPDPKTEMQYDQLIRHAVEQHFPELLQALGDGAHLWLRAQIWQESRMDHFAVSEAGARGLMQIMPETAIGLGVENIFDPAENITAGVRYMAQQWRRLPEIPLPEERLRFALASYNGGRGYINMAMVIAREAEGLSGSHTGWRLDGCLSGDFQHWCFLKAFLSDTRCVVRGRRPDYQQIRDYVSKIEERYLYYRSGMSV